MMWSQHRVKGQHRGRKTEKEEDEELLAAEKRGDKQGDDSHSTADDEPFVFTESPSCTCLRPSSSG
jgi:hypothetical protein